MQYVDNGIEAAIGLIVAALLTWAASKYRQFKRTKATYSVENTVYIAAIASIFTLILACLIGYAFILPEIKDLKSKLDAAKSPQTTAANPEILSLKASLRNWGGREDVVASSPQAYAMRCPDGQYVNAVHWDAAAGPSRVIGISLRCRPLNVQ